MIVTCNNVAAYKYLALCMKYRDGVKTSEEYKFERDVDYDVIIHLKKVFRNFDANYSVYSPKKRWSIGDRNGQEIFLVFDEKTQTYVPFDSIRDTASYEAPPSYPRGGYASRDGYYLEYGRSVSSQTSIGYDSDDYPEYEISDNEA